jgi:hypothetical protein
MKNIKDQIDVEIVEMVPIRISYKAIWEPSFRVFIYNGSLHSAMGRFKNELCEYMYPSREDPVCIISNDHTSIDVWDNCVRQPRRNIWGTIVHILSKLGRGLGCKCWLQIRDTQQQANIMEIHSQKYTEWKESKSSRFLRKVCIL